jgi:hypothetical protein
MRLASAWRTALALSRMISRRVVGVVAQQQAQVHAGLAQVGRHLHHADARRQAAPEKVRQVALQHLGQLLLQQARHFLLSFAFHNNLQR